MPFLLGGYEGDTRGIVKLEGYEGGAAGITPFLLAWDQNGGDAGGGLNGTGGGVASVWGGVGEGGRM